jgi:hypothetical protein
MIEQDGTAPYAPIGAVMTVIDAYRNRPVPTPITVEVAKRIGIPDSLTHRTVQALKLLDLLDGEGNPTTAFEDLRKAGEDEFRDRLAEVVRGAYADLFAYRDPTTDDPTKIVDAFRAYKPHSMRNQMARLFLGLCEEAGIITAKPQVSVQSSGRAGKTGRRQVDPAPKKATLPKEPESVGGRVAPQASVSTFAQSGADHMAIRGLLQTLPPVGSVFSDAKRREWADAVLAAFALIYEREPQKSKGGEPN